MITVSRFFAYCIVTSQYPQSHPYPSPSPDNWLRVYIPPDILQDRFQRCGAGRKSYRLRTERGRIGNYAYIWLYSGQHP